MIVKDSKVAQDIYEYIVHNKRRKSFVLKDLFFPKHEWDFETDTCAFANLVRVYPLPSGRNQGIYAGRMKDGYVVIINEIGRKDKFLCCEVYKSLGELKDEWIIDPEYHDDGFGRD